jgi:hypothetical protein
MSIQHARFPDIIDVRLRNTCSQVSAAFGANERLYGWWLTSDGA